MCLFGSPRGITGWLQLPQLVMQSGLALYTGYPYRLFDANALVSRTTGLRYKCGSCGHKFKAEPKSISTHSSISLLHALKYVTLLL